MPLNFDSAQSKPNSHLIRRLKAEVKDSFFKIRPPGTNQYP